MEGDVAKLDTGHSPVDLSSKLNAVNISNGQTDTHHMFDDDENSTTQNERNDSGKLFDVAVTDPVKVGEGIGGHIVYRITFQGYLAPFNDATSSVNRRFSDFLGLHVKISNRYQLTGVIIPPAPDKDVLGTTKVKMSKDSSLENEFVERRRLALERFLMRLLSHPLLREDMDLREFLDHQGDLPRSNNTQLLSGASAKKIFRSLSDAVGKIAYKMDDPEEYFDLKVEELDSWERQLKRLLGALTMLVTSTQDLSNSKLIVSRTVSQLSNVEEHTGLAQTIGRLADTEDDVSQRYGTLAEAQLTFLVDCARDSLGMIQACKDALSGRVRVFRNWKNAEASLRMKREQKVRTELSGRTDERKLSNLDAEIEELNRRMFQEKDVFDKISNVIKAELDRVDMSRFEDFKLSATRFLEMMLQTQEKLLEAWESYLVRAKSIN